MKHIYGNEIPTPDDVEYYNRPINHPSGQFDRSTDIPTKIDAMGMTLWEKRDPIYNSTILGVPVKFVAAGIVLFKILAKIK